MKNMFLATIILSLAISFVPAASAGECYSDPVFQYSGNGTVKSGVFLRDDACMETNVLTTLAAGTSVTVIGYTDGWYRVESGNARGWVGEQFIDSRAERTSVSWGYREHMATYPSHGPSATPSPTPQPAPTPRETVFSGEIAPRFLVKLACLENARVDDPCKAVYYIGADGKRHAFPDGRIFATWYANFNAVRVISPERLRQYMLGANIVYRPGVRMVKFLTDPKVYAVGRGGVLRWVRTEELARRFYGLDWNTRIDDLSDALYTNYTFGDDIVAETDFSPTAEQTATVTFD